MCHHSSKGITYFVKATSFFVQSQTVQNQLTFHCRDLENLRFINCFEIKKAIKAASVSVKKYQHLIG